MSERNARIARTFLGVEDHGILTFWIYLEYDGAGQGFGGYRLDGTSSVVSGDYCARTIRGILDALDVKAWEELPGTPVRAFVSDDNRVRRIGRFLKETWFDPEGARTTEGGRR
jgi:hypothetical protein